MKAIKVTIQDPELRKFVYQQIPAHLQKSVNGHGEATYYPVLYTTIRDDGFAFAGVTSQVDERSRGVSIQEFLEVVKAPQIRINDHNVEFAEDGDYIQVGCTRVSATTVRQIHEELQKRQGK